MHWPLVWKKNLNVHGENRRPHESHLKITDTDGDEIEFVLSQGGVLSELCNGKIELQNVHKLTINPETNTIKDKTGVFTLKPSSHGTTAETQLQALRSLAAASQVTCQIQGQ